MRSFTAALDYTGNKYKYGKLSTSDGLLEISVKMLYGWDDIVYVGIGTRDKSNPACRTLLIADASDKSSLGFLIVSVRPSKKEHFFIDGMSFGYRIRSFGRC